MLSIRLPPPIVYAALTADTVDTVNVLYAVALLFASRGTGSAAAMIQDWVLPRMRGVAAATYVLTSARLGFAVSPYLVEKVLASTWSLRIGVLSMSAAVPVALIAMWRASRGSPAAEQTKAARAHHAETSLPDLAAALVSRGESSSADK